jgi:hypothetical protein
MADIAHFGTDLDVPNGSSATISGTYTLGSASSRCVVMLAGIENANNTTGATPTLGSNPPSGMIRAEQGSGFEDDALIAWWFEADLPADGDVTAQLIWTTSAGSLETSMYVRGLSNVEQVAPVTTQFTGANQSSCTVSVSPNAGDWVIAALSLGDTRTLTWQNGETEVKTFTDGSSVFAAREHGPAVGTETAVGATYSSSANRTALAVATFQAASGVALEGYQFFDDGTEAGASAKAAQDTSISLLVGLPVIIRVLLNASGSPTVEDEIQFKRSSDPDTEWEPL